MNLLQTLCRKRGKRNETRRYSIPHRVTAMKEILFKGKRTDTCEWEYGFYCHVGFTGKEKHYIVPNYASDFYGKEVDPETVSQFTGLFDKNGTKVYENDLLGYKEIIFTDCSCSEIEEVKPEAIISIVTYNELASVVKLHKGTIRASGQNQETNECLIFGSIESGEIEVIGNLADNPDLGR